MIPTELISILKAKQGELIAASRLDHRSANRTRLLFEIGRMTDRIRQLQYVAGSANPTMAYLDKVVLDVIGAWGGRPVMLDTFEWQPDARVETGENVTSYVVESARRLGGSITPVVGYDRWQSVDYQLALRNARGQQGGPWCLRLDSTAIDDAAEPELLLETVASVVEFLEQDPLQATAIVDFGDVSGDHTSVIDITSSVASIVEVLRNLGFRRYALVGCSLPRSIDLAVESHNATGYVVRKEMVAWQALRQQVLDAEILYGDYGVRGPTTIDAPSKYTNGKIRYTVPQQTFVVRGYPFRRDGDMRQMHDLASTLVNSEHYLGADFSWGDAQIQACAKGGSAGTLSDCIANDTNHHLTAVGQEVAEFERGLTVPTSERYPA